MSDLREARDDTPADLQAELIDALRHCEHYLRGATLNGRSAAEEIALRKATAALAKVPPQAHSSLSTDTGGKANG